MLDPVGYAALRIPDPGSDRLCNLRHPNRPIDRSHRCQQALNWCTCTLSCRLHRLPAVRRLGSAHSRAPSLVRGLPPVILLNSTRPRMSATPSGPYHHLQSLKIPSDMNPHQLSPVRLLTPLLLSSSRRPSKHAMMVTSD